MAVPRGSATKVNEDEEPVIGGPISLFDGSFILEFLKPKPSRHATVLMRATYKHDHPLSKKAKKHPQSPPLHLHFQQAETFAVLQGSVGITSTWSATDTFHTPKNTGESKPHVIETWVPHAFFPDPNATEDTVIIAWAHPDDKEDNMMDRLFFQTLLSYVSDCSEGKEKMSILQVMLTQHVSDTALVWFPRAWFLGPLRWWIPLQMQAACATIATWQGMKPLMRQYLSAEDWKEAQRRMIGTKMKMA
ncbi:hypothetical protein LTR10_020959 [Elasticomyces elasticus]|uniref:Cupin type-1 domain-containing protein n=1 Tax=Exophiala sideris TaxID=1016849 RepID=A0ABR0J979_9EURO|nr:hypothetical protein LTR10_020959 [Elasticomyces elasticus]KAK5027925.1 hypothetical protein LTS07_006801 [Exophiala sideris]KAK5037484.1 hypothetical protein LTR13_004641 [Exophiala sideris]KAK5059145.1 hypothetical protein LTR69_006434 [Exophiala sideris]KAK5182979.1 hypothetical protein LTR44_004689 [Eurotiomycetes sp. CCFEE 6388]